MVFIIITGKNSSIQSLGLISNCSQSQQRAARTSRLNIINQKRKFSEPTDAPEQVQRLFYDSTPVDKTGNARNSTSFTSLLQSVITQSTQCTNFSSEINNGFITGSNSEIGNPVNPVISSVESDSEGKWNVIELFIA